ncbi:hypothetical protein NJC10_05950 [Micrococcus sp. M4NT]|uniref:hypothetical protein n=1 Tax=Micrococcus sp. M4NT TaxID=2957501 RepID=UPI0029A5B703|nr:hypothetical protein [Micrococcus sp. M4NT]MDX2341210.1 hypothetical protein [Micrococcus sp. M4NT]
MSQVRHVVVAEHRDPAVRRAARGRGVPRLPEEGSDEYAALAKGVNRLLRRADRALARERSFAQDITLTLRTSSAMLEAGLRSPGGTAAQWRTTAGELAAEATRARELLDDLALLTRLGRADLAVDSVAVDPADIVAVAWGMHTGIREIMGISFPYNISGVSYLAHLPVGPQLPR